MSEAEEQPGLCGCGAFYALDEWRALRRLGFMDVDEDGKLDVELRTCARCGSTLTIPVPYKGGSSPPPPSPR